MADRLADSCSLFVYRYVPLSAALSGSVVRCFTASVKRFAQRSSIHSVMRSDSDDPVRGSRPFHSSPTAISTHLPTT